MFNYIIGFASPVIAGVVGLGILGSLLWHERHKRKQRYARKTEAHKAFVEKGGA